MSEIEDAAESRELNGLLGARRSIRCSIQGAVVRGYSLG